MHTSAYVSIRQRSCCHLSERVALLCGRDVCPEYSSTTTYVSSYYYICVLILCVLSTPLQVYLSEYRGILLLLLYLLSIPLRYTPEYTWKESRDTSSGIPLSTPPENASWAYALPEACSSGIRLSTPSEYASWCWGYLVMLSIDAYLRVLTCADVCWGYLVMLSIDTLQLSCHTTTCILILLHMCPHTTIYVSSYYYMCPHTTTYVSSYYHILLLHVCWYYYICVFILLHMCPHTQ